MNAFTVHFVSLEGERHNLVVWGTEEETRHLGVCLEDAQRAGECQAAYLVPGIAPISGMNHWRADEYEDVFNAWRRGEETTPRTECYACGVQTPIIEGEEQAICWECVAAEQAAKPYDWSAI